MGNAIFGYENRLLSATLSAGSAETGLGVANLQSDHGDAASSWQTKAGVRTASAGAWFLADTGDAAATWRAFVLARTNLTSTATVRWRVGAREGLVEETPLVLLDFLATTPPTMAGWSAPRGSGGGTGEATYWDANGNLVVAGASEWRISHDPVTRERLGLLIEPTRTNAVPNPRAEGAVPGTPGTAPSDGWSIAPQAGLSSQIVGTGTENGLPYIDVRFYGTTSAAGWSRIYFAGQSTPSIVAATGETWTLTVFARVVGGSLAGLTDQRLYLDEFSGTTFLASNVANVGIGTGALTGQRHRLTATLAQATTTRVRPHLHLGAGSGVAVDVTLRIALPQCEKGEFPTMPIMPPAGTRVATTRTADSGTLLLGAAYASGTLFVAQTVSAIATTAGEKGSVRWQATDASNSARVRIAGTTVWAVDGYVMTGGSVVADLQNYNFSTTPTTLRTALRFGTDYFRAAHNGTLGAAVTSGAAPLVDRISISPGEAQVHYRRILAYVVPLSDGQIVALSNDASTLDPAAVTYDSGSVPAGVAPGVGQSVHVAPTAVTGRYVRCDIDDGANPDDCLRVALAYAGPVWQPAVNIGWDSSFGIDQDIDEVVTRGGQEYPVLRAERRRWDIALDAVESADLWPRLQELARVGRMARNVLFVPDPDSADRHREAVFGRLRPLADVTYALTSTRYRAWRARITERL